MAQDQKDFFKFVENLILMWSRESVPITTQLVRHDVKIDQISFISQGSAATNASEEVLLEVRDAKDQFRGRALRFSSDGFDVCEVIFQESPEKGKTSELSILPVLKAWEGQPKVTLRLVSKLDFPFELFAVFTEDGYLRSDSVLSVKKHVIKNQQDLDTAYGTLKAAVFGYQRKVNSSNQTIEIGSLFQFSEIKVRDLPLVTSSKESTSNNPPTVRERGGEDRADHKIQLLVHPKLRTARAGEFTSTFDGNFLDRKMEYSWQIKLALESSLVDVSGYPIEANEAAEAIASALSNVQLAHFHLRRWLAGQETGFGSQVSGTSHSQGTASDTSVFSLFSRVQPFFKVLQSWVVDVVESVENDIRPLKSPLPEKLAEMLYLMVSDLYALANSLSASLKINDVKHIDFVTDMIMRQFSPVDSVGTMLGHRPGIQKLAFAIVLETMRRRMLSEEVALNTLPMTPDIFDTYVLLKAKPDDVPVLVFQNAIGTNLDKEDSIFVNAGPKLIRSNCLPPAAASRLAPLIELAEQRVVRIKNSIAVKTAMRRTNLAPESPDFTAGVRSKESATTTAQQGLNATSHVLFPYYRRLYAITSSTLSGTLIPGQALRLKTDPQFNKENWPTSEAGFATRWEGSILDPNAQIIDRKYNKRPYASTKPGIYSDSKTMAFLGRADTDQLAKRGGLLWSQVSPDTNTGYSFSVIGAAEEDLDTLINHTDRMTAPLDPLTKMLRRSPLPTNDLENCFAEYETAHEEIWDYLKEPKAEAFEVILNRLGTDLAIARKLQRSLSAYLRKLDTDIARCQRMQTDPIGCLFSKHLYNQGKKIGIPPHLHNKIPFKTQWFNIPRTLFPVLCRINIDVHERISTADDLSKTALAPLYPGETYDYFDLSAVEKIYQALTSSAVQTRGKSTSVESLGPAVELLVHVWVNAVHLSQTLDEAKRDAFADEIRKLFTDAELRKLQSTPKKFWHTVVKRISQEE